MENRMATSVREFLDIVSSVGPKSLDSVAAYRGHRDITWELVPLIARWPFDRRRAFCRKDGVDGSAESSLYKFFRDTAASLMPTLISSGDDKLAGWRTLIVAQHHGVPTRLLDWTTNPLVALFFAVEGKPIRKRDSVVFAITERKAFTVHGLAVRNGHAPFYYYSDDVHAVLRPPYISPRIGAQGSVFTIRENPGTPIEPDIYITIPRDDRPKILRELNDLNINRMTLFPDMDGIGSYLSWACSFWDKSYGIRKPH